MEADSQQSAARRAPQRIAITGATGLIGAQLHAVLRAEGNDVLALVRRKPAAGSSKEVFWDPERGELDRDALHGVDAVVHLAGAGIADKRWTPERKRIIEESRRQGTLTLARAIASLTKPPRVLVSASAIGYYGDRGDELVSEESLPGQGFLPSVCQAWEQAADPAREAGIRVVHPRIGIVLAAQGGALAAMLRAFKLGAGGRMGSGKQYMSWISLTDIVGALRHAIETDELTGPVNLVAPQPVTNAEFTKTLGKVLRRPTLIPMPAGAVTTIFGEMGKALLLEGARVSADKLVQHGFRFLHPHLEGALRAQLQRET